MMVSTSAWGSNVATAYLKVPDLPSFSNILPVHTSALKDNIQDPPNNAAPSIEHSQHSASLVSYCRLESDFIMKVAPGSPIKVASATKRHLDICTIDVQKFVSDLIRSGEPLHFENVVKAALAQTE